MYIRTKNGIFDTSKGIYTPSIKMWAIGTETIYEKEVIAQSDIIEELCDGFYIDVEGHSFNCIWVYNDINSCKKAAKLLEKNVIRGFIKTDNGLNFICEVENLL